MRTAALGLGGGLIAVLAASCTTAPVSPQEHPVLRQLWGQCDARLARAGKEPRQASGLHARFFGVGRADCSAYRRFFELRVRRIKKEGWGFESCHGAIACTDASHTLRLSPRFESSELPWPVKTSLLLHEARHTEGWAHVTCPSGRELRSPFQGVDLRGKPECDSSELGALGVQYVWLRQVLKQDEMLDSTERQLTIDYSHFILSLISREARARLDADDSRN